jgi:hypothetical protein
MSSDVIDLTEDGEKRANPQKKPEDMSADAIRCEGVQLGKAGPRGTLCLTLASSQASSDEKNSLSFRPHESGGPSVDISIFGISNMQVLLYVEQCSFDIDIRLDGSNLLSEIHLTLAMIVVMTLFSEMCQQVSKATAANALLRITHSAGDTLLDFTQTVNGKSWRDTFKETLAKALQRNSGDGQEQHPSPGGDAPPQNQQSTKSERTKKTEEKTEKLDASDLFRLFQKYGPK